MIATTISSLIAAWCSFNAPNYTKESKWYCAEVILNCAIDNKGKLTESDEKLKWCIEQGQKEWRRSDAGDRQK